MIISLLLYIFISCASFAVSVNNTAIYMDISKRYYYKYRNGEITQRDKERDVPHGDDYSAEAGVSYPNKPPNMSITDRIKDERSGGKGPHEVFIESLQHTSPVEHPRFVVRLKHDSIEKGLIHTHNSFERQLKGAIEYKYKQIEANKKRSLNSMNIGSSYDAVPKVNVHHRYNHVFHGMTVSGEGIDRAFLDRSVTQPTTSAANRARRRTNRQLLFKLSGC